MWPFWSLTKEDAANTLNRAEFTVYCRALERSEFNAILNEGDIREADRIVLPPSCARGAIRTPPRLHGPAEAAWRAP